MSDQQLDVATMEVEPKSITNIYYDCLERIFDFLDLESLMNVAGTCKRLQIAAAAKFADDFGNACVVLYDNAHSNNSIRYNHDPRETLIDVRGLKFCLTFLRCFGAKILKLYMDSKMGTRNGPRYVDRYTNQYCANTLISINFICGISFSSEMISKPFEAVEKLLLYECNLGDQLPNYVHWFPKVNHLTFSSGISIDGNAIAVSFPHLEHLTIQFIENRSGLLSTERVIEFLHANQKLQSLKIILNIEFEELLDMISGSKSILKLKVYGRFTNVSDVQLNRLANEHQLLEELHFEHFFVFEIDEAIALIRQLNSLKRFKLLIKDQTECNRLLSQLDSKWKHETKPHQLNIPVIECLAYL